MSTSIPSNPVKPINFYNTDNFDNLSKALSEGKNNLRLVSEGVYVPSSSPVTSLNLPGSGIDISQAATKPLV